MIWQAPRCGSSRRSRVPRPWTDKGLQPQPISTSRTTLFLMWSMRQLVLRPICRINVSPRPEAMLDMPNPSLNNVSNLDGVSKRMKEVVILGELIASMLGAAFPPAGGTASFVVDSLRAAAPWTGKSMGRA